MTVVRQYLNPKHLPTIPILQENQWNRVLRSLTINIIGSEHVSSLISEIHHQVPADQLWVHCCVTIIVVLHGVDWLTACKS